MTILLINHRDDQYHELHRWPLGDRSNVSALSAHITIKPSNTHDCVSYYLEVAGVREDAEGGLMIAYGLHIYTKRNRLRHRTDCKTTFNMRTTFSDQVVARAGCSIISPKIGRIGSVCRSTTVTHYNSMMF